MLEASGQRASEKGRRDRSGMMQMTKATYINKHANDSGFTVRQAAFFSFSGA